MPSYRTLNLVNSRFSLFFVSQIFVASSAFMQVVAVAKLIVGSTNSGLVTGFSIVCAPIPGIVFSLFAGGLGERENTKGMLVGIDVLRGIIVILFTLCRSAAAIFFVLLVISFLDVLYSPPKTKLLTLILDKKELMEGNSVLNGGYGAVSLVVPMLTGLFINTFHIRTVFIFSSALYLLSALSLSKLNDNYNGLPRLQPEKRLQLAEGLRYCLHTTELMRTILTLAVLDYGTTAVNIAFYSLAFDGFHVTSSYWGFLLSIFYGMNIFSMGLLFRFGKLFQKAPIQKAGILLIAIALVWFYYSTAQSRYFILFGVAAEGFCSSLCITMLVTHLQEVSRKDYIARAMGARDLLSNSFKIAGIGFTVFLMKHFDVRAVFICSAFLVLLFSILQNIRIPDARR